MSKLMEVIKSDLSRYQQPTLFALLRRLLFDTNFTSVVLYRFSHQFYTWKIPIIPKIIMNLNKMLNSIEISYAANIGPGLRINHSLGIVVGGKVNIGENLTINQCVTIGGNSGKFKYEGDTKISQPYIGNNVQIGAGAKILGPINVGDKVVIGANSVVLKNISEHQVVAGVPAKVIK